MTIYWSISFVSFTLGTSEPCWRAVYCEKPRRKPKCIKKYPSIWCAHHVTTLVFISFRHLRTNGSFKKNFWVRWFRSSPAQYSNSVSKHEVCRYITDLLKILHERSHNENGIPRQRNEDFSFYFTIGHYQSYRNKSFVSYSKLVSKPRDAV